MYKIINTIKTLEQYNKKYKNLRDNLVVLTKKEVEEFDLLNNCKGEKRLLKNKKWALIKDTYYEIPKPIRWTWFRNLNAGAQACTAVLLAGAVGASVALPIIYLKSNNTDPIPKQEKISLDEWKAAIDSIISDDSNLTMKWTLTEKGFDWERGGEFEFEETYNYIFADNYKKTMTVEGKPERGTTYYTYSGLTGFTHKNEDDSEWFAIKSMDYDLAFKNLKACKEEENYNKFTLNNSVYSAVLELEDKEQYLVDHNVEIELDTNNKIKSFSISLTEEGSGFEYVHTDKMTFSNYGTSKIEGTFPEDPTDVKFEMPYKSGEYSSEKFDLEAGYSYIFYINVISGYTLVSFSLWSGGNPVDLANAATCNVYNDSGAISFKIENFNIVFDSPIEEDAVYIKITPTSDLESAHGTGAVGE